MKRIHWEYNDVWNLWLGWSETEGCVGRIESQGPLFYGYLSDDKGVDHLIATERQIDDVQRIVEHTFRARPDGRKLVKVQTKPFYPAQFDGRVFSDPIHGVEVLFLDIEIWEPATGEHDAETSGWYRYILDPIESGYAHYYRRLA